MIDTLDAAALRAETRPAEAIDAFAWLGTAIDADATEGRFDAWGRSTVIDENTGTPVLAPELFAALHKRAAIDAEWPVGNAGLLHIYGYLLSSTPTPYGLKRERWLDGQLARAYGLGDDAFVPWAAESTLLERVTTAASALLRESTVRTTAYASLALGRAPGGGAWALVYAVRGRLVTTFPVASVVEIESEWDADPTRLRWNATLTPLRPPSVRGQQMGF